MTCLLVEDRDGVRILTMNRPEKHNALDTELTTRLLQALRDADTDGAVRSVVLTGSGKSFCAGADTSEFDALAPHDPSAVTQRADLTTALHAAFSRISKPVVAAVRGNALGGGAGLALACDMTVMAADVLDTASALAAMMAAWNPLAMSATKRLFHRVADVPLETGLAMGRDANVMMRGFRGAK